MAGGGTVVGSALVNLKSDTSGFLSDLTSAFSKGKGLASGFGDDLAGSLKGAGGIMTAGITAPIVAMGAFSVKSFEDINDAEDQLIGKTNVTGAAATQMRTSFTNVFGNTPASAQDVVSAMTAVHDKLGLSGTALENVSTQALNLSRIMGTDVSSTVGGVTKLFQAFGVPTKDMSADMDQLYAASTHSGVALTDMTTAVSKVSTVAGPAKVSLQQTEAAIGAFATSGVPARQSATLLTSAIQDFTKAGIPASKALQDIANGSATTAEKEAILTGGTMKSTSASTANSTAWDKLSGSLSKTKGGYNDITSSINNSNGAINKQAEDTMTLGQKFDEFKNKMEVAFAPVGKIIIQVMENAMDAAKPLLDILTRLLGIFSTMPAPIQLIVVAIAGIAAAIGPVLMIIGMIAPAIGPIVAALGFIGIDLDLSAIAAGGLTGALGGAAAAAWAVSIPIMGMELPLIAIIAAVVLIGAGLYLLYTRFKPFHDAVDEVAGWLKTLLGDLMSGNFGKFGDDFKKGILAGLSAITSFDWGGAAAKLWSAIVSALSGFGTWLWGLLSPLPLKLWNAYIGAWISLGTWLWGLIQPLPLKLWNAIISALQTFGSWIWTLWVVLPLKLWGGIISALAGFGSWLLSNAETFFSGLPGKIQGAIVGFGTWLISAADGFFTGLPGKIQGAISGLGDWLISAASGFTSWLSTAVQNAIKQLPGGSQVLGAAGAVSSGAGTAASAVQSVFAEGGPVTADQIALVHAGEYVVPAAGTLVSSGTGAQSSAQGGDFNFNVTFQNASLTSQTEAEQYSRIMAYQATLLMRRQGLSRQ